MTRPTVNQLVNRRANAMAQVLLTDRDDLITSVGEEALGVDLIVSIVKPGRPSFRQFGVILLGHVEPFRSASQAASIMQDQLEHRPEIEGITTPVCLFLFNMTGDQGYYAWLLEPSKTNQGPRLRKCLDLDCQVLGERSLEEIVRTVNDYYDAVATSLMAS